LIKRNLSRPTNAAIASTNTSRVAKNKDQLEDVANKVFTSTADVNLGAFKKTSIFEDASEVKSRVFKTKIDSKILDQVSAND